MPNAIKIIVPEIVESIIQGGLIIITEKISQKHPDLVARGFLGGEFGYGADYKTDVFIMHPYCWCEKEDCPWCAGCTCPPHAFHYFVDDKEVTYNAWAKFFDDITGGTKNSDKIGYDNWMKLADEANARRQEKHDPLCPYCKGEGLFVGSGSEPSLGAPNFWHKPSGFKSWWYKYIGRDMQFNKDVSAKEWDTILKDCLKSIE